MGAGREPAHSADHAQQPQERGSGAREGSALGRRVQMLREYAQHDSPRRMVMHRILLALLLIDFAVGCASAQTLPAPTPTSAATSGDVDSILDALDARGKELSDFTA